MLAIYGTPYLVSAMAITCLCTIVLKYMGGKILVTVQTILSEILFKYDKQMSLQQFIESCGKYYCKSALSNTKGK